MPQLTAQVTAQLNPQQPPPADYYAANVRRLLTHVLSYHGDLLSGAERAYAENYLRSSVAAQRLYARIASRKGPCIRIDKLRYEEVENVQQAVAELVSVGLLEHTPVAPADHLLGMLTNGERRALFPRVRGAVKAQWIVDCLSRHADQQIRGRVAARFAWIRLAEGASLRLMQLLFFGDERQDTATFILEDLGLTRYARYPVSRSDRQFKDPAALARFLRLRQLSGWSHRLPEHPGLAAHLSELLWMRAADRLEQRQIDRTLNRLGHWFERHGDLDAALSCYGRSRTHPARERRVRLLVRLADPLGADLLITRMRAHPWCAQEQDYCERFRPRSRSESQSKIETTLVQLASTCAGTMRATGLAAGTGSGRSHARRVREPKLEAESDPATAQVDLAERMAAARNRIEDHAAELLASAGGVAWHLENQLPAGIAGLAYWQVIFAPVPGAFVNPYQSGPLDLYWPDFARNRQRLLAAARAHLAEPADFRHTVLKNFDAQEGVVNRFVSWRHWSRQSLELVLEEIPHALLLGIADHVIHQPNRARTGFPDLTVLYGGGHFEFVEVKGPTDQLQPAQRVWLRTLADLGCPARVLKFRA